MVSKLMTQGKPVHTIDLNFQDFPSAIAAYLIPHRSGALLVECGPGSTIPSLISGLDSFGYTAADISDVILTHIHLDHAGASGWFAKNGARIHVHPLGAPHLINPAKLLASAGRIYGDKMESLWGEFLPVPEEQLIIHQDKAYFEIEELVFHALDSPGHANHHFAYLFGELCFSGDICGVRIPGSSHIRLPMPPPEFHIEKWRQSIDILRQVDLKHILPTHFGSYSDPDFHLQAVVKALNDVETWMEKIMPLGLSTDEMMADFLQWEAKRAKSSGVDPGLGTTYETANPSWMSLHGIERYWQKYRQ